MSLLERIEEAKKKLSSVETRVTFEDGSTVSEKRTSTGSFEYTEEGDIDINEQLVNDPSEDIIEQSVNDSSEDKETAHSLTISGAAIASPVSSNSALSKRQLKKRLRRQRVGYVVDLTPDLQMARVSEGVYLGSQDVAHDIDILTSHHITHIINCASGVHNIFEGRIKYLRVDALDLPSMNLAQYFDECHLFMRKAVEAGGNVLVHCNAGVSRSATIVLSYIMRYEDKTLKEALNQVNAVRRVGPNAGFMQQLLSYESTLRETRTQPR